MKKLFLILAMVLACTLIDAQTIYRFTSTHSTCSNITGMEDDVKTPYMVNMLIMDGRYILNGDQKVILSDYFREVELDTGGTAYKAYGIDWDGDEVYILLDMKSEPGVLGFFWSDSYQVLSGDFGVEEH